MVPSISLSYDSQSRLTPGTRHIEEPVVIKHLEAARVGRFRFVTGSDDVSAELAQDLDPDSCTDYAIVKGIDRIYQAMQETQHGQEVGGPIDIACLDSSGFRWLREKSAA